MSNNLGVTSSLIVGDQLTVTFGVTGLTAVEDASIWFSFDGSSLDSASISFIASYGFEAHTFDLIAGSASIAVTYNVDPLPGSDLFSVVFDFAAGTNPASFQIDDVLGNNTGDGYTTPVDVVLYPTSFNTLPTGDVSFSGTLTQNETLSAANTIVDFDGFSSADYQWQRSSNGVDGWADISGATASDYTLQQSEVGYYIRVVASYEDGQGNTETFYSDVSGATIANVNDAPVASADSLSATEDTNDTFLASELLSNDSDLDGDALVISSVTSGIGGTVTLNGGNVDFSPTLNFNGEASFTYVASDQNGGFSDPTTVTIDVSPVDDPATGGVSISGTQRQGQTLTAISTLADNDGIQSLSFQWKADGVDLDGETDSTLLLSQQHVGKTISVVATLLDNDGTETSDSDTAASAVANLNDAPAGTDNTISLNEDGTHTLLASDFGFSDLVDGTDSLAAVKITSLPGAGELRYNGVAITAQQVADGYEVSAADLGSSLLVFVPAADASGVGYASFNFQVRDDGGTANGGVDLDPSANTITFDVTAINDAPVLDAAESPELNSLVEDVADVINTGTTIAALVVDGSVTDADGAALESAYVSAVDNANGSWQFSTDGSSWNAFDFSGANSGKGLLLAADDLVRFVPNADWNGSATLTFGAWDQVMGAAGAYADISTTGGTTAFSSETDTASITVTAVVDIADDSGSTTEDTAKDLSVFVNDSFDGTPSITSVTDGAHGTVSIIDAGAGTVRYTPDANYHGGDSFTYTVTSGGVTEVATVTVTVNQDNDAAVFGGATSGSGNEDNQLSGTLTATDTIDGMTTPNFRIESGDEASNGTAAINSETGAWTYDPSANFNGSDSFIVSVTDDDGNVETRQVDLSVTAVNDAPSGSSDIIVIDEGDNHTLGAPDFGFSDLVDGTDSLAAVKITSLPGAGELRYNGVAITAQQVADGYEVSAADLSSNLLVFVPAADASGVGYASFDFQVRDDGGTLNGGINLAPSANTLTFDVTAINDAPVLDDSQTPVLSGLVEDVADVSNTGTMVAALVVNGSITDADGGALESIYVSAIDDANGTWQFSTDGGSWATFDFSGANSGKGLLLAADDLVCFVPNADWNGSATLTFGAWDQSTGTAGAYADISTTGGTTAFSSETDTASITVTAVVDIADDSGSTTEDTAKDLSVFVNDSFDGTPSITSVTDGAHGTVSILDAGTGSLRYTPDANYYGGDSFTYTVTSGGVTETATVTMTVSQGNDAAVFGGATSGSGNEDNQLSGTLTVADTIDGIATPNFRIEAGDGADNGTAAINSETGAWTYDPSANFNGSDSFIVSVTDDDGNVETHQVDLTLAAVNDDPANSVPGAQTVDEDDSLVFNTVSSNLISVSDNADVAAGGTDNLTTVLSVINGVVTVSSGSGATVSENGSASVTVSGTTTQINAALAGLVYAPSANFNGDDTLTINTSDSGNTGSGGVLFDEDAITITVNSVNDDPGGTVLINGDGSQLFRGNELSADTSGVTDVDGLGAFSYQWFSDASPIVDATSSSFTLTEAEEGTTVSVRVSYLDDDGTSETVAGELVIPATMSFAGIVYHWQNRVLLEGVTISATPDGSADTYDASTPASGDYLLDPLPVADQSVDVSRATDDMGTAISASDATALLKILVGKNPNGDGEGAPPLSPFQVLAADVDRDGTLGINDAIGILKMAVNASDAPADEWLFVEESRDLWDEGSNSSILGSGTNGALWNPGITYPSDGASDLNFVAVLKGDVNSSWGVFPNLPAGSEVLPEDYFADNAAFLGVPLDLWSI